MLLVFTLLTAVMTYPQALHLRDGVHDAGDPLMLTWVLAWVGHQLPRAPAHIFELCTPHGPGEMSTTSRNGHG